MAQMTRAHWEFIENLVNDTKAEVILPDYPLTPRYNYEDVFEMIEPLYKETVKNVGAKNLIMMGDSAGGGLAAALLEKIEVEAPSKTILISPWLDVSMSNEKMKEVQEYDKDLNIGRLEIAGNMYAREINSKNYLVSPIYGDVSKLKNVVIFTGTYDILNPDAKKLKQKIENAGVSVKLKEYPEASHIWIIKHNCEEGLVEQGYNDLVKEVE